MTKIFQAKCPAKINLFLKLTGKRVDGYHELESLFAFLDLADELSIQESANFKLEISGEFGELVDQNENLFTKILNFFNHEFGISKNLEIKITKNIPVGAGLGGGSSDAAYFMHGLNEIFELGLSLAELQKISLKFGSDIFFLLGNKAAIVKGRGEIIAEFPDFSPIPALLINPKISVSTKEIFTKFGSNFSQEIPTKDLLKKDVFDLLENFPNDMEKPAIATLPLISEIIENLKNSGAKIAKMSGSGATCFGIFENEKTLDLAKEILTKKFPEFFIKKTIILANRGAGLGL
ncbi:MAG: 4-(cytidine 5'-diphospho)-2-C-methyl-D-erythritol kinase [Pseudomonadota bacterium]